MPTAWEEPRDLDDAIANARRVAVKKDRIMKTDLSWVVRPDGCSASDIAVD